jgi:hypothetical protein
MLFLVELEQFQCRKGMDCQTRSTRQLCGSDFIFWTKLTRKASHTKPLQNNLRRYLSAIDSQELIARGIPARVMPALDYLHN